MNAKAEPPDNILAMLYDRQDGFVSADELARAANLDAAGLSVAVKELAGRGFRFEQSPAHGLRLIRPTPLDAHLIERDLGARRIGRHAIVFAEVDSTNDVAADSARQEGADGLVVLAENQRRGRGRLGRHWISPPGTNILMSVLLVEPSEKLGHEALTIAAGLATAEGVEQVCSGVRCELRWPNDVLIGGGKLAGVLLEMHRSNGGRAVVIGIGIN
ncbi:MAG: biotin--[acetyl-CoA-carboxylase] ligase, partial [Planctomycetota bacterium]